MQHQEAWLIEIRKPAEETLVGELIESLDNITADVFGWATDRLNMLQASAARKHREARQQAALPLVEQVVAPLNRSSQCLLPAGQVASPAAQRAQRFLQPDEQRLGRKELDPRGGKLNRKRQAVDSFADAGDRGRILVRGLEIRFDRHGALDKEPDGLELREGRQIR